VAEQEEAEDLEVKKVERLVARLLKKLQATGTPMTRGQLNVVAARDRKHLGQALDTMVEQGLAKSKEEGKATWYESVTK
jgi:hypothetical protein